MSDVEIIGTPERGVSRRKFIMGVIAAGATTSSVGYLFKGPQPLLGAAVLRERSHTGALDLAKEALHVLPIQFVETLELDPAPPLLVLLVVNRLRCVKGVRAFDDPALRDDALLTLDPPRSNRDGSNQKGQGYGQQPRKHGSLPVGHPPNLSVYLLDVCRVPEVAPPLVSTLLLDARLLWYENGPTGDSRLLQSGQRTRRIARGSWTISEGRMRSPASQESFSIGLAFWTFLAYYGSLGG